MRSLNPGGPSPGPAGATPRAVREETTASGFVFHDGEEYYRIAGYDRMPSFLMTLASDTDLWMYLTSRGGLTAGRVDPDGSLFPYETVDKLHDGHHHTGPITLVRVRRGAQHPVPWHPFRDDPIGEDLVERSLAKNVVGNRVIFEEIRHDLGLEFRTRWSGCDELGFVRTEVLRNRGGDTVHLDLLDGLRNVLPPGAPLALYQQSSSLVDAYKRTDLDADTHLATFSLTAKIIDRAEAAEQLRANVVWCHGLPGRDVALAIDAVDAFRRGESVPHDEILTGRRGNYLVRAALSLAPGASVKWHLVADVGRSHVQLAALRERLQAGKDLDREIEESLAAATRNLRRNVASADGLQLTGHAEACAHHFANVLFNNMRGGVFARGYDVPRADFADFLRVRQRGVADRHAEWLRSLPAEIRSTDLVRAAGESGDADLERLSLEYLPLHFGRRHGDPSRPWNRFEIRVRNPDGSRALRYEGNWRDIFQNWESLSLSFPRFLPGLVAKFVNASTVDGFNPYRITRDGVDWEVVDPQDPWSYIGYWGDHQIVYLLRLLEALSDFSPGTLEDLLGRELFAYANVPYRLRPYEELLADPHATITYDDERADRIDERVRSVGTDGRLVLRADGAVLHVSLLEKLLVPALSKLSNLVADGGIWMNTQRPEWNDANNALVGHGVSMVTLCHLRRYLAFLARLVGEEGGTRIAVSIEVVEWFRRVGEVLRRERDLFDGPTVPDRDRRRLLDALGGAFSDYRGLVYERGLSGRKEPLGASDVRGMCHDALHALDHAIWANRREDRLYHAYNVLELAADRAGIRLHRLDEMLEGQVAALSSGVVSGAEAVQLLSALFESRLFRTDARSFLLYPEKRLPGFLERNLVPADRVAAVPLLRELVDEGETSVIAQDASGAYRFHGDFRNARDLAAALDRLAEHTRWTPAVSRDRGAVLDVFEAVFRHRSFTGRSGTMYGYEGLGCIYWHMVAKLLLAVQEIAFRAARHGEPPSTVESLLGFYDRIRAGLGFEKTPAEWGAFPTDPYSHTPRHAGAQQPGMTGQVKEEILTRFGELGVSVEAGTVRFRPRLLRSREFLTTATTYRYVDVGGAFRAIDLPAGSVAFTFGQVPVVYTRIREEPWIRVSEADGKSPRMSGNRLGAEHSRSIFDRCGLVARIDVGIPEAWIRP